MAGTAIVRRPTEEKALARVGVPPLPPVERLADLLILAREMGDRYGARHFDHLLDRAMGATS